MAISQITAASITTSSPYTIHTFTGPGTFTSNVGSYSVN